MSEKKGRNSSRLLVPVLVVLLIGASFIGGSLFSQFKSLGKKTEETEKAVEKKENPVAEKETREGQPKEKVLGVEALAEIEDSKIVKGDSEAPVTIVEFSEFLCPFCAEYMGVDAVPQRPIDEGKTYQKIMEQYVQTGKARYIFRQYPVHGAPAKKAAEATFCADDQGKFWQYHDLLFEKFGFNQDDLPGFAEKLGLDGAQFSECLSSGKYVQAVEDDFGLGRRVGVSGTPSFFINGRMLVGAQPFEAFKKIIDEELIR